MKDFLLLITPRSEAATYHTAKYYVLVRADTIEQAITKAEEIFRGTIPPVTASPLLMPKIENATIE